MEPQQNSYVSSGGQKASAKPARTRIIVLSAVVLVFAAILGLILLWAQNLTFRMTGTNPSLDNFSYAMPQMDVNFNRTLSSSGLSLGSNPNIIRSTKVSGKKLTIVFKTVTLEKGKTYTITIKSISDSSGKKLTNIDLKFTAKDIPYDSLSTSQQKAVVGAQDSYPYSASSIGLNNTSALTDQGVSQLQIEGIRDAFFNFSKTISKQFKQVTIESDSVSFVPHDPESDSTTDTANFKVMADSTEYTVRLDYSLLTTVEVFVYNNNGTQIYDSGTIDKS